MWYSILVCLITLSLVTQCYAEKIGVYVLGGQSNQAEFAYATDPMSVFDRRVLLPNKSVYYLPTSRSAQTLAPLTINDQMRFGPELSFGKYIDLRSHEKVAIVKYAIGSTDLEQDWDPDTGAMYAGMMNRVNLALNGLTSLGYSPRIRGFNWIQGEEDARVQEFALNYGANLEQFFDSVRKDLGYPDLPIVMARINAPGRPYRNLVRDAQVQVAESMDGVTWLDTDMLPIRDKVHYSGKGQYGLGKRFAEAYDFSHMQIAPPKNVAVVPEPNSQHLVVALGVVLLFGWMAGGSHKNQDHVYHEWRP